MEANSYECTKGGATWQAALPLFTLEPRQANTQAKTKASEHARTEQQPKQATKQPNKHTTKLANTPANTGPVHPELVLLITTWLLRI